MIAPPRDVPPHRTKRAAHLIWQHWQAGHVMGALPDEARPSDRTSAYDAQKWLAAHSPHAIAGWKIAATSAAGQAHIGVDGPLAGRLLAETLYASGATLSLTGNRMRVAEPEFAFRAGRALMPRTTPFTVAEVVDAMDALIPAIEAPDSRFADFATAGAAQLIADNACTHQLVVGEPTSADWKKVDLANHPVHARVGTRLSRDGIGANVLGDPRIALTWLVNELSGLGIPLQSGQIVTTGTSMPPLPIEPGDHVVADFGPFGSIEATFA